MRIPSQKQVDPFVWSGLAMLALLMALSLYLGFNRIFQVDEVLYSTLARFMAEGKTAQFVPNVPIILVGPLTWVAGAARDGVGVLVAMRLPFVGLMWVNAILMVKATGFTLRSRSGLVVLLLASTLAPMWDYGFEIRHDVPLVTATLVLWCFLRAGKLPVSIRMFLCGVTAACMQLIAFKGFLYAVPMLGIGVYITRPNKKKDWILCLGMILIGISLGLLIGRIVHEVAGTWELTWRGFQNSIDFEAYEVERFSPSFTLLRIVSETPILACAGIAIILCPFFQSGKGKIRVLLEAEWFPEWAFAVICLSVLMVNPTPFPYNLIHALPAFFIVLLRFRKQLFEVVSGLTAPVKLLVVGSLLMLHGLSWAVATVRHFDMDNERQCALIRTAEAMTDPALHRVFDGSGLVATRNPIGEHWFIHSFTIRHFIDGSWPTVRSLLAQNPTPVILPNYRTGWLPKEDQVFMDAHYVSLAEDLMVLGTIKGSGTSIWEILAEGRYLVTVFPEASKMGKGVEIDGKKVEPGIRFYSKGNHPVQVPDGCRFQAVWLGPQLHRIPNLGAAPHPLFVNWY